MRLPSGCVAEALTLRSGLCTLSNNLLEGVRGVLVGVNPLVSSTLADNILEGVLGVLTGVGDAP